MGTARRALGRANLPRASARHSAVAAASRTMTRPALRDTLIYRCLFGRSLAEAADAARPRREARRALDLVESLISVAKSGRAGEAGERRSALIVGGAAEQRQFCETLLRTLGLRVDVAASGLEALLALRAPRFGMVIVDAATPDIDSRFWPRLFEALMRAEGPPHLYVVTDAEGASPSMLQHLGAHRAISRPVRALSLVEAIDRLR